MTLRARLTLAALMPAAMAVIIGVALFGSLRALEQGRARMLAAEQVVTSTHELVGLAHAYVLHPEDRPRQQFLAVHQALSARLAAVELDDRRQRELLEGIGRDSEAVKSAFLSLVASHRREPRGPESELVHEDQDRSAGQVLVRAQDVVADAVALKSLIGDEVATGQRKNVALVLLLIVAVAAPLTAAMSAMRRTTAAALEALSRGTAAVSSGAMGHRIGSTSRDEVGQLSRDFDRMTVWLQETTVSRDALAAQVRERLRAEEDLRGREERLRLALSAGRMAAWDLHLPSGEAVWSEEHDRMLGYEPGSVKPSIGAWMERVHPADREATAARLRASLEQGSDWAAEFRTLWPDGTVRWVEVQGRIERSAAGKPLRQYGVMRDTTERKQAETLRAALNSIHQIIHSTLEVGEILQKALVEAARAVGSDSAVVSLREADQWRVKYVYGLPLAAVGARMGDDEERHALLAVQTRRPVAVDDVLRDGRVNRAHLKRWGVRSVLAVPLLVRERALGVLFLNFHASAFAFRDAHVDFAEKLATALGLALENARLLASLQQELSERRLREERIALLTRLYAVLSRVNEALVRIRGEETLFREVCRIVAQDGGFPLVWIGLVKGPEVVPAAGCGPSADFLEGARVEVDGALGTGPTGTCIREDRPAVVDDFDVNPATVPWRPSAQRHGFRASAAFPLHRQGRVIGAMTLYSQRPGAFDPEHAGLLAALCADLSYALDALRQEELRSEAEQALRERERSLREADERKNEFLAVLSHELRNPLAPIANSLRVLERAPPGGEQALRAQAVIGRQVGQLSRLVDDLLDVTRISRNKIQLHRERIELNELLRRALEDHRLLFEGNGVRLELTPAPEPVFVFGDGNRLAQVVGNLLTNAAKFTPRGGSTCVSLSADSEAAALSVRDTGVGMAPEMLPRLFQPFMQADRTLDRSKGGLGLGLALVKGLIELHGGGVSVRSDGLGKGAEFQVRLPLDLVLEQPAAQVPAAALPRLGRRRVLIIEDNRDAADSLREVLQLSGHEVAVAFDGAEGVFAAKAFRPEVVLCDIGLPGMNGFEVARALRADAALKETLLVALSGYALPDDIRRSAEAGFRHHLAKPPSLEELERVLAGGSPAGQGRGAFAGVEGAPAESATGAGG